MDDVRRAAAEAIRKVRDQVQWKPGKDVIHLKKRQAMGHLPQSASLTDYTALISGLVKNPKASVFVYRVGQSLYIAVRDSAGNREWLVIFGLTGIMETAFPPHDIDAYLGHPGFTELGTVEEVLA